MCFHRIGTRVVGMSPLQDNTTLLLIETLVRMFSSAELTESINSIFEWYRRTSGSTAKDELPLERTASYARTWLGLLAFQSQ